MLITGFISLNAFCQTTFEIDNFSPKYKGVVTIADGYEDEITKKGVVSIIDKKTNKKIITIESDGLTFDLNKKGKIKTNVQELPYGEQSLLISEDVNFDGIKDLAIMDGQFSCYGLPSYNIYLQTPKGLKYNATFSELSHDNCGMFYVNHKDKTIETMTKSGAWWHKYLTYKVINNVPKLIVDVVDNANLPFVTVTSIEWNKNGKKKSEKEERFIDLDHENLVQDFSFKLAKNNKKVVIFNFTDGLHYALIRPDNSLEFLYLNIEDFEEGEQYSSNFALSNTKDMLSFNYKNATYQVYQNKDENGQIKVGVIVKVNGKTYNLKGDPKSIKGSFEKIYNNENNLKR